MAGPETPKLMVDVVVPSEAGVVLIRRGGEPFEGQWALPGGFVEVGETVHEAAVREAAEETGLAVEISRLVGVYSEADRDPRGTTSASPSWSASSAARCRPPPTPPRSPFSTRIQSSWPSTIAASSPTRWGSRQLIARTRS